MHKILAAALVNVLAVSSAAALNSRQVALFKDNFLKECVNGSNTALKKKNAANVPPNAQDLILRVCTCSADVLVRDISADEVIAAAGGTILPSISDKAMQAFKICRPPRPATPQ